MLQKRWRTGFAGMPPAPSLRSWLTEPDSLTARCQRQAQHFRVRLLASAQGLAVAEDRTGQQTRVRDVLLECDGFPVIFAHTSLSTVKRGRLARWLAGLGSRSLGSLLFAHPGFSRGPIEYCRLRPGDPLYRYAARHATLPPQVWARRSRHRLGGLEVLVTEVFLPSITSIGHNEDGDYSIKE